jgi:hypothetical protein
MTGPSSADARTFEAPLRIQDPVRTLGRGLWLYLHLAASANSLGHICKTVERLSRDLGVTMSDIERWLGRLDHAKLVTIATPPPYLVVKLNFWSGSDAPESLETPAAASESASSHREVPVSSKQAAASILEDGGLGEGDPLVQETLRVLGEGKAREIADLESRYPRLVILKALLRVKTTPPQTIRKSKLALFRYLLTKFANDHDHHASHHP